MLLQRSAPCAKIQQRCQGAQQPKAPVLPRSARNVRCAASKEEATPLRNLALGAMTAASVAGIALQAPMDAQAVFGGGGVGTPLNYEDFSNRDMRGVLKFDFSKAQIRGANFSNSILEGMSFYGAIAPGANFHGANLRLANLDSADLENADLSDAVLEEAYVSNTQFRGTKIENTDWTEVQLRSDQRKFLCSYASGVNPKTQVDTRESLLCP